jgi:hypothetical protein
LTGDGGNRLAVHKDHRIDRCHLAYHRDHLAVVSELASL